MTINGSETHIAGVVEAVNERGIRINGAWANVSKFAQAVTLPDRGAAVTVTLDKSGFIRSCGPADGGAPTPTNGATPSTHRDRTITRLAVLKAAAEFGAARPNLKSGDVLAIAATWERWVTRDEEMTFNLQDEF